MRVDPPTDGPTLPTLDRGVQILDTDDRATGALQSLVLDHLLMHDGPAIWVDSHGHAATQPLARLAPSDRLLDRIQVARAFTPFQHYSLVETLPDHCSDETVLVVLPEFDWFYRQDDLARSEGAEMVAAAVATIRDVVDRTDVPILATRAVDDELTAPLADLATEYIQYERTQFGPRFVGDTFETLVYQEQGYVQTTLAFWERVLAARHGACQSSTPPEVSNVGAH